MIQRYSKYRPDLFLYPFTLFSRLCLQHKIEYRESQHKQLFLSRDELRVGGWVCLGTGLTVMTMQHGKESVGWRSVTCWTWLNCCNMSGMCGGSTGTLDYSNLIRMKSSCLGHSAPTLSTSLVSNNLTCLLSQSFVILCVSPPPGDIVIGRVCMLISSFVR